MLCSADGAAREKDGQDLSDLRATADLAALAPPRGPAEHLTRDQIIVAAAAHFRHYGYSKTTVSDLARAIGYSKAYIYKFFESKQAIGDAVSAERLGLILADLETLVGGPLSPADKLRGVFMILIERGEAIFFDERRLHDIVVAAVAERWRAVEEYRERIAASIRVIVLAGRESGAFERDTPVENVCRGIMTVLRPFAHPVMLEQGLADSRESAAAAVDLILRSLRPAR